MQYPPRLATGTGSDDMQAEARLLRQAGRVIATVALAGIVAYIVAATVRYGLIEREDLGLLCDTPAAPWWCSVRLLIIRAFLHDVFGLTSVALAVIAAWRRSGTFAVAAGLGVAVVSQLVVQPLSPAAAAPAPSGLVVLQVAGFPIRRRWSVVWRRDQSHTAAARRFVAYLQEARSSAVSSAPGDGNGKRRHAG